MYRNPKSIYVILKCMCSITNHHNTTSQWAECAVSKSPRAASLTRETAYLKMLVLSIVATDYLHR